MFRLSCEMWMEAPLHSEVARREMSVKLELGTACSVYLLKEDICFESVFVLEDEREVSDAHAAAVRVP